MPKISETPRFRGKPHTCSDGSVVTYYFWDGRGRGLGTIALGKDRDKALSEWARCEQGMLPRSRNTLDKNSPRRSFRWGPWIGVETWARQLYLSAEGRCCVSKKTFTILPQDFIEVVKRAGGRCEVSGIPFDLSGAVRAPFAPSLDRIDSLLGYEPGNIRLVCHLANVAMNTWGIDPVGVFAEALLRQMQNARCAQSAPMLQEKERDSEAWLDWLQMS